MNVYSNNQVNYDFLCLKVKVSACGGTGGRLQVKKVIHFGSMDVLFVVYK